MKIGDYFEGTIEDWNKLDQPTKQSLLKPKADPMMEFFKLKLEADTKMGMWKALGSI